MTTPIYVIVLILIWIHGLCVGFMLAGRWSLAIVRDLVDAVSPCDPGPAPVDLRKCKPGDMLVSKRGLMLTYVEYKPECAPYSHTVKYPCGALGTRRDDGRTFAKPLPEDHDIVRVIPVKFV